MSAAIVNIEEARDEMDTHIGLNIFKNSIEKKMNSSGITHREKLIYKLAHSQVEQIEHFLEEEIITPAEVSELLLDEQKADDILSNL